VSDAHSTITIGGVDTDAWLFRAAVVRERLFAPTRAVVRFVAWEIAEPDELTGKDVTVHLELESGARDVHGVIVEVSERAWRADAFELEISIASKLAILELGRDHRIFLERSVKEVVSDVLARAGLASIAEWSVHGSYEPHENIVQYGESDYSFVTRLLFEEGIGYMLEQREDGEHVVFFDDDKVFQAIEGDPAVALVRVKTEQRQGLTRIAERCAVASDKVMLNDYDLKKPGNDLEKTAEAPDTTAREVYDHPGGYVDGARGKRLTDRLLERLRMRTRVIEGDSDVWNMSAGRFFSVVESERPSLDGDLLLLEVTHRLVPEDNGTIAYTNSFEAIPLDVPYRPETAAPRPVIAGVQHALATVPGGEEIHADDHGRSKVRFLWDRSGITDDKSSTWLRVGQLALGGSMVMPRVDFEVIVDFELGDLDRPAISGHLYNAEKPPPYALPAGKTVSSIQTATTDGGPGANELRFEDAGGKEEIFIHASKDLIASIDNDTTWRVGNNQTRSVGNNESLTVTAHHKWSVTKNRKLEVSGDQDNNVGAEYGDGTGKNLSLTIDGNRFVKAGTDHRELVKGKLSRHVGSLQSITGIAGVTRTIGGSSKTTVGLAWAEVAGGARGLTITGKYTETVGALKFIKAKNVSVKCDAFYKMLAAAETLKAGGNRSDTAKGGIALTCKAFKIDAKNIVLEAKSKLVFRGGGATIELTKSGDVKIKAPTITVKNAKALNQMQHKSG
jgi:type VI secretion system secreted protein VgrG